MAVSDIEATLRATQIGSVITFRSKNPADTVLWSGTFQGVGSYAMVRQNGISAAYNEAVRQVDSSVPQDYSTLNYLVITLDNNSDVQTNQAFALDWITDGSLVVASEVTTVTLQVIDSKNTPQLIVDLLRLSGYSATITGTTITNIGS